MTAAATTMTAAATTMTAAADPANNFLFYFILEFR
jgi:hypothetical protein